MPEVKISELPEALALTGAEAVPVVQSGSTRRTTTGAFATAAQGALAGTALQPGDLPYRRPEDFGAVPGADATAAIQAAIADLSETGGEVWLEPRTYLRSGTIIVPNNVTLVGLGAPRFQSDYTDTLEMWGTWIETIPGSNTDGIIYRAAAPGVGESTRRRTGGGLRNIGIHGNRSASAAPTAKDRNATGHGIVLQGVSFLFFENVVALRCPDDGVRMESRDYGGSVGNLSCNNVFMDGVSSRGNGGRGFLLAGGDSMFARLDAGFNGTTGISHNCSNSPLVASLSWDNLGVGIAMTGPRSVAKACVSYDNHRSGFLVNGPDIAVDGHAFNNGKGASGVPLETAGVAIGLSAQDVRIDGNFFNRPDTVEDPATQQRGIYSADAPVRVTIGSVSAQGNTITAAFFTQPQTVQLHGLDVNANARHPGFTAQGRIDFGANDAIRIRRMSFETWDTRTDAPGGVLATGSRSLVSASIAGGATITDVTSVDLDGDRPFVIVRNANAAPLVFQNGAALALGGADVSLAQNEAIMLVRAPSGTAWQMIGKVGGGSVSGIADVPGLTAALAEKVTGDGITDVVRITQAAYDLLAPPDPDTLYVIVG